MNTNRLGVSTVLIACAFFTGPAMAAWESVRIGDIDGFGYVAPLPGSSTVYKAANGGNADTDGDGLLEVGEFLPDLNESGGTLTGSQDDFDNRLGEDYTCVGCDLGTDMDGVEFTDISLSTSYDASKTSSSVWDANTETRGSGGIFPMPPSTTLSNQPGFEFDFTVASSDISEGDSVFLNVVFGDYDVTPASVKVTDASGVITTIALAVQGGNEDGLIQAATATLAFDTVFSLDGVSGDYIGSLMVDFDAPREPYTAFDYVELSRVALVQPVPLPAAAWLFGSAIIGAGVVGRRKKKAV